MTYSVVFSPEALEDLLELYDYIATRSDPATALGYLERIERTCLSLATSPERGSRRDDIRQGLRIIGFERRVTIAFSVSADIVTVLRILYGGRDVTAALHKPQEPC